MKIHKLISIIIITLLVFYITIVFDMYIDHKFQKERKKKDAEFEAYWSHTRIVYYIAESIVKRKMDKEALIEYFTSTSLNKVKEVILYNDSIIPRLESEQNTPIDPNEWTFYFWYLLDKENINPVDHIDFDEVLVLNEYGLYFLLYNDTVVGYRFQINIDEYIPFRDNISY